MTVLTLYHGSSQVVERPSLQQGRPNTDFGQGFYCTESLELASEWACDGTRPWGFVNEYRLDVGKLTLLNLDSEPYTAMNWIALLLQHRQPANTAAFLRQAEMFVKRFSVETSSADVICGHRADDSYFRVMRYFLRNELTINQLERVLRLGGLGGQVVLKSEDAFQALSFVGAKRVDAGVWYARRSARDVKATQALVRIMNEDSDDASPRFWELANGMRGAENG